MTTTTSAEDIISAVGGRSNVSAVTHCATRLRFNLVDDRRVDGERVESLPGVLGVSNKGGQYQLIIGPSVPTLYAAVSALLPSDDDAEPEVETVVPGPAEPHRSLPVRAMNKVFDTLSGIFVMFIPALIAAGMISAVLSLLSTFHLVAADSSTYVVLSAVQQAVFYFLPVFTGYAAGVKLGTNPFLGIALGAFLCYSTINQSTDLAVFGLPVMSVTYSSTVFPVILGVLLMSYVERGMKRITPDLLKGVLVPMVTLLVGAVATVLVLGPLGATVGNYIASGVTFISSAAGWLAPALVALVFPVIVFTGMHYGMIPIAISAFAANGFDPLLMVAGFLSNMSEAGAAAATSRLEADPRRKAEAATMSFSALCGVTEPTLFGITIRNRRTLLAVMLGGFAGALYAGVTATKAFGFVGGLPSLPLFIDPAGGLTNLINMLVAVVISLVATFVLTLVLNRRNNRA